jgi:hypothetical protein
MSDVYSAVGIDRPAMRTRKFKGPVKSKFGSDLFRLFYLVGKSDLYEALTSLAEDSAVF